MGVSRLTVRLLDRDKKRLRELARAEGEPLSVLVRRLLRRAIVDRAAVREGSRAIAGEGGSQP